jgi:hypothetical protein
MRMRGGSSVRGRLAWRLGVWLGLAPVLLGGGATWVSAGLWDTLVRRTAGVADDIPVSQTDEVAEALSRNRKLVDDAIDARMGKAGKLSEGMDDAARNASRATEITRALTSATRRLDPGLLRRIDDLDEAGRKTALVLAEGSQKVASVVPDLASRARFLERGGANTVAAVGLFGDDAARSALRLDSAIQAGKVISPAGVRRVTLADFGRLLTTGGEGAWKFWNTKVLPHWGKWLAGGALAAFLVAPEQFIDAAGNLTENGFQRIGELLGEVTAAAIRGVGEGAGGAVKRVQGAIYETYFSGWKGLAAGIGTFALLILLFPRTRWLVTRPLVWLCRKPRSA